MKLTKCEQCGGPTAEGLPLCPDCMRATGAAADQIAAAEELRDIARVLSITANTDANIREAFRTRRKTSSRFCTKSTFTKNTATHTQNMKTTAPHTRLQTSSGCMTNGW